ncbi:hypothetical protein VTK26DRAFT_1273 [Humicola hyalothermophila]
MAPQTTQADLAPSFPFLAMSASVLGMISFVLTNGWKLLGMDILRERSSPFEALLGESSYYFGHIFFVLVRPEVSAPEHTLPSVILSRWKIQ